MSTITQIDNEHVYRKPYPILVCYHQAIREQLQVLQAQGIIRPSQSAYNSPLIPVPKKDGGIRLCLDFRALNTKIKDDRFPLPNIQAILQQMGSSKIFSSLDLRAGYYQIPLDESSKEKTAFTSPEGHWEFNSLPFGVKSAPGAFQRVVNTVLTRLIGSSAHVYLDYIITDHFSNLEQVLSRLQKAKLKVKLEKCDFF